MIFLPALMSLVGQQRRSDDVSMYPARRLNPNYRTRPLRMGDSGSGHKETWGIACLSRLWYTYRWIALEAATMWYIIICSGNRISTPCRIHGGEPGSFGEILGVDGGSCRTACAANPTFDRQTSCDATLTTVTLATRAILSQCPRCGDNGEAAPLIYMRFMDNIFILGPTRGYGSQ